MKGCRPLSDEEVNTICRSFGGTFVAHNKALFVVGHRTGFQISELLSLKVGDVQQRGKIVGYVIVACRHMKKKTEGRTVLLHPEVRAVHSVWLEVLAKRLKGTLDPQTPVFCSRVRDEDGRRRALSREQAWGILTEAFAANELSGKLGSHCMRKTFANRMYDLLKHDLVKVQRAMGHKNINSTVAYLSFRKEDITDDILAA